MGTSLGHPLNPGVALGILGGIAGLAVQGAAGLVTWLVVGYFAGKSLQSVAWAVTGGPDT